MPESIGYYGNEPGSLTYIADEDWQKTTENFIPMNESEFKILEATDIPTPRCPNIPDVQSVEELYPSLDAVAKRPYSGGLWPAWELKKGEKILVKMSNWHDPMVIEAVKYILTKYETDFTLEIEDLGPPAQWQGHDEVDWMIKTTQQIAGWYETWETMDRDKTWNKILQGFGGPILRERYMKIQRMPFIVPEMVVSKCHQLPAEVLIAIDEWTWKTVRACRKVHITDPEGTDIRYTNHDEYWAPDRTVYRRDHVEKHYSSNIAYGETYLPGHIWGKPPFMIPTEDGEGVIQGTMNHLATYPRIKITVKGSNVVDIEGGGVFGEKLRKVRDAVSDVQYSGMNGKGIMKWWEASIGTSPKIHRPRKGYGNGMNCAMYERMRSGIIHIGFGTIISSDTEKADTAAGKLVGHWHVHLNFPTYVAEGVPHPDGTTRDVVVIKDGRLKALDAPEVRAVAAKFGNPDELLREDWIPAVPGLNMTGDYNEHYAKDPWDYTLMELDLCRKYHPLFQQLVSGGRDGKKQSGTCH